MTDFESQGKSEILILDDEIDYCLLMKHYFEERKYDVYIANNLEEGLRLLWKIKPAIMFLDNNLPDGEGWSKIDEITGNFPNLKLYLISAYGEKPELINKTNNITFWEKPLTLAHLDDFF